jgi:hypothetical protein
MRKAILLLLPLLFGAFAQAQIEFTKDTTDFIYIDKDVFDYGAKNVIINNSSDPNDTVFIWTRVVEDIPDGWETAVCEAELCHPTTTTTSEFNLGIGESFDFKLNYYPWGVKDCGNAKIVVESKLNASNRDSFYSALCTFNATASVQKAASTIEVYPNPAQDFIQLSGLQGVHQVSVFDLIGNKVIETRLSAADKLNVSKLPRGIYIIRSSGDHSFTKKFRKI